jgi:hypothetical protein
MLRNVIPALLLSISITNSSSAQHSCMLDSSPDRDVEEDEFNAYVLEFEQQGLHLNTDVHCLPVVFHIINHPGFQESQVHAQLTRTNEHLRRTNIDTVNTRPLFTPFATDSHIELKLASLMPDGSPFNGIHHIDVPGYELSMTETVIAANMYDHTRYVNVWVFPGISASGVFPWEGSAQKDGIIVAPENVGISMGGNDPNAQGGKVFTHEIGHYLGLYHPFHGDAWTDPGNCSEADCQTMGDRCCDTPMDYRTFPLPGDFCTLDTLWCQQGENIIPNDENYMFYNLDHCQNMFSYDQRTRMRACLSRLRASLTTDETHASTGIECQSSVGLDRKVAPEIQIVPNPMTDRILVEGINAATSLMIFDGTGRLLLQQRVLPGTSIDVSALPAGVYYLRLQMEGIVVHRKVVKE